LAHRCGSLWTRCARAAKTSESGSLRRRNVGVKKRSGIGTQGTGNGEPGTGAASSVQRAASVPGSQFPVPSSQQTRPASRINVRPASMSDLPAILALRMALLREHSHNAIYGRLRPDAESRAAKLFAAQLQSPNEVIFLAEDRREPVGILRCIHSSGS